MAGILRSTGITRLRSYYDPLRLPTAQPHRLFIPGSVSGHNPRAADLSGSVTFLSMRAVRSHPGELDHCTCLCLRRPYWLHPSWRADRSHLSYRGRIRFTLAHYGSHRAPPQAPPRRLPDHDARSATCSQAVTWLNLSFNKDGQAWPDAPGGSRGSRGSREGCLYSVQMHLASSAKMDANSISSYALTHPHSNLYFLHFLLLLRYSGLCYRISDVDH